MTSSDGKVGISGLVTESVELARIVAQGPTEEAQPTSILAVVDAGVFSPDPDSRLGTFMMLLGVIHGARSDALCITLSVFYTSNLVSGVRSVLVVCSIRQMQGGCIANRFGILKEQVWQWPRSSTAIGYPY